MKHNKPVILFDGVCNLCNTSVQFILKKDAKNQFLFASLQSDAAKNILLHKNTKKKLNEKLNTIYLVDHHNIYDKSTAILRILRILKFPYNCLYIFIIIPKFVRDYFYDFISRNRYRWFGKKDVCMIPKKEYLERFLND